MRKVLLISLLLSLLMGCSEPVRDNPYDPGSNTYNPRGSLTVIVKNRNGIILSGIPVRVANHIGATNSNGIVAFELPVPSVYQVIAGGNTYDYDTTMITLNAPETRATEFHLNGVPQLYSLTAYSELRPSGTNRSTMHLRVNVFDPDSKIDIDSVWVFTPYGNIRMNSINDTIWTAARDTLPDGSDIVNLVGFPIIARANDDGGNIGESPQSQLNRVFISYPTITTPLNNSQMYTDAFNVQWFAGSSDRFQYTFRVLVFTYNSTTDTLIKEENIPQNTSRVDLFNRLGSGVFTVEVHEVDAFGNYARSSRNNFTLIQDVN
ncbi:MAG: hypothetical protein OEM52_14805 [bacterium]|nr:hypothetical protein [bacterium]